MAADESIIRAIEQAVIAEPDNPHLRSHLAALLVEVGRDAEALDHARAGLALHPGDITLLDAAIAAGGRLDVDVSAYRQLRSALSEARPSPSPSDVSDVADPLPDTVADLLAVWAPAVGGTEDADEDEPVFGALSRPVTRLKDVGGLAEVKDRIYRSFLAPMQNPQLQAAFGKSAGGGLLLWGPPGCGKTFIARALAGELGAQFYDVGLNDVLDMWIGNSEKNLHEVFEVARRNAPCVVFFDELDAIGLQRSQLRNASAMRGVVNQLLAELDGATSDNAGVFFLGATNHPWDVDPALLRPGRFDRTVLVLPPDLPARAAIFEYHLAKRPTVGVNILRLAKATDGLSGADLRLICDDATESAMQLSIDSGVVEPISHAMLENSARSVKSSIGTWIDTARNFVTYANADGRYDELSRFLLRWRG